MRATLIWKVLQVLWLSVGLVMLGSVLWGYTNAPIASREPTLALISVLLILSFPSGILGVLGAGFLSDVSSDTSINVLFDNVYLEALVMWAFITAMGWLQWFVLLPLVFRRVKEWMDGTSNKAA